MLNFLKQTRKLLNSTDSVCIVLGNESCDLDSAVCAVTLAYHYQQQQQQSAPEINCIANAKPLHFLPVLNISRSDYPLKTEVYYLFNQNSITAEHLTFRDELQPRLLCNSKFILVDHHVSPFAARCIEVFDHRAIDEAAQLPTTCRLHIELVGSCATLIAEQVLKTDADLAPTTLQQHEPLYTLLRNTIVLDTINFSESTNRFTPKDLQICTTLETLVSTAHAGAAPPARNLLFESLVQARADVSNLTALQLLRKDLKILTNTKQNLTITLPGFPMLVQHFIVKPDATAAVQQFASDTNSAVVLLMGMFVREDGGVERDLGLIDINAPQLCAAMRKKLLGANEPTLKLQQHADNSFLAGIFYKMLNVKATRKHVLPMIKQLLDQWPETVENQK